MSTQPSSPQISIIMPCYNRAHGIARILRAYDRQSGETPFELIAVDDGSTDDTLSTLRHFQPQRFTLRVESMITNSGPAAARNRGIDLARAPLVAFVGDDICPATDFVQAHTRAHDEEPREATAILGRTIWPLDLPRTALMTHIDGIGAQQFSYRYMRDGQCYDFRHLYTSNVSLKRSFLQAHGGHFDTIFTYAAFEDGELARRLERRGLRIRYHADIVATHYHYYSARTFADRQYKCGLMSWVFIRKHPSVFTKLAPSACLRLILKSILVSAQRTPEGHVALEERAQQIAAEYEAAPAPALDGLYFALLQYYYCKGQATAVCEKWQRLPRILDQLAVLALQKPIIDFLRSADR